MKIGILSDTHGQKIRTEEAISLLYRRGARCFFHCGDLTTPEVVSCFEGKKIFFVFGNNDRKKTILRKAIRKIGGVYFEEAGSVEVKKRVEFLAVSNKGS